MLTVSDTLKIAARSGGSWSPSLPRGLWGEPTRLMVRRDSRLGITDTPGIVRETSLDFYAQAEFYHNLLLWDALAQRSAATGVALQGALFVIRRRPNKRISTPKS